MRNSNGNIFSFIPHVCYFLYHPRIAASEDRSLTTLSSTQMRGRKHNHKNIPAPFYQSSVTPPLPSVKTIKNLRKFKHARHFYIDRGLCIFLVQVFKTVSISFNNSELVRTLYSVGQYFIVEAIIHHYYCMLVKSFKGVTSRV